ncbi:MAG: response regulator transcription factor [Anaerolineales bacterium]
MILSGKILIVDDEPALRQTLARILQQAGLEVTSAENAEQALAFLQNTRFDLVYMDIRMPGMAGLDALEAARALQPGLPVVLFTAQPDLTSALEALRRGASDYLLKPLKPDALLEKTRAILSAGQMERRRREILAQIEQLQAELKALEAGQEPAPRPEQDSAAGRYLALGDLSLDLHARRLSLAGRPVSLPPASFDILLALARHAPQLVDYQTLVVEALGYQAQAREAQELVKWHVHHIRQAIEADPQNPARIINVRGVGYRLLTG